MRRFTLLLIGILSLISFSSLAQIVPPAAANDGAIFDSLAGILALIGAGYGIFKFRSESKDS